MSNSKKGKCLTILHYISRRIIPDINALGLVTAITISSFLFTFCIDCNILVNTVGAHTRFETTNGGVDFESIIFERAVVVYVYEEEVSAYTYGEDEAEDSSLISVTAMPYVEVEYHTIERPTTLKWDDEELLCRLVQAEAGTEGLDGKRRTCDIVLNRKDSSKFPNTVYGVISQKNKTTVQFATFSTQSFWTRTISDETRKAVQMELKGPRLDPNSLYFGTIPITQTGLYRYGNHYYSR